MGLFLFGQAINLIGQEDLFTLRIIYSDLNIPFEEENYISEESAIEGLNTHISETRYNGYSLCSLDSTNMIDKEIVAYVSKGPLSETKIRLDSLSQVALSNLFDEEKIPMSNVGDLSNILAELSNRGYPFARFNLNDVEQEKDQIDLNYNFFRGELVLYDSLIYKSESKINPKLLSKYLGIKPGDLYNESELETLNERIDQLQFYKSTSQPGVLFKKDGAQLYLFAEKNPSNLFNGIIGFQPNSVTGDFSVTGDVQIGLSNNLNRGESFNLHWKKIAAETQELNTGLDIPYLFYSDIGISGALRLFKQDTSFVNLETKAGLKYFFSPLNSLEFFFQNESDNKLIEDSTLQNLEVRSYGLQLKWQKLDRRINPSKGFAVHINGMAGRRTVENDADMDNSESIQYKYDHHLQYFIPFRKRNTVLIASRISTIIGDQLFTNEFNQIGGINSLRGFDQNSIFSSSSVLGTIEYRYFLDKGTHVKLFFDQMWYEKLSVEESPYVRDTPFGFGTGFTFATGNGIFTFEYALGKEFDLPVLLRNGKIHFGFISLF